MTISYQQQLKAFDQCLRDFDELKEKPEILATPKSGSWRARLQIYADGYWVRVQENLERVFPYFQFLCGVEQWGQLGCRFVMDWKNLQHNLIYIARDFPTFLQKIEFDADLVAIAEFEQLLFEVSERSWKTPSICQGDLASLSPQSKFNCQNALEVWSSSFSFLEAWQFKKDRSAIKNIPSSLCLFFVPDNQIQVEVLSSFEGILLDRLRSQKALEEALEGLPVNAQALQQSLMKFLGWGVIQSISN